MSTTEREAELPELPEPIGLGLCRYPFAEEDMRSYALSAADQRDKKVREELEAVPGIIVSEYLIPDSRTTMKDIRIAHVRQIEGPPLWAVRRPGICLSKSGHWEWEPMPSERDSEFLARCRFASVREAIEAIDAARTQGEQNGS